MQISEVSLYTYIHTYICTYNIRTYIHTMSYIHTYVCMYIPKQVSLHYSVCVLCSHTHAHIMLAHVHEHTHAPIHTHVRARAHTHTHTHTQIRTHTQHYETNLQAIPMYVCICSFMLIFMTYPQRNTVLYTQEQIHPLLLEMTP